MTTTLVVHVAERDWGMGELGPCLFVIWRGTVTEEAIQRINEAVLDQSRRLPGKCAYLNVMESKAPPPNAALRKLAMAGVTHPDVTLACMAAVMEGNELQATVVRAVLTGMALLRPQKRPQKIFKSAPEMARWVEGQLRSVSADVVAADLTRAVESLRSQMPK